MSFSIIRHFISFRSLDSTLLRQQRGLSTYPKRIFMALLERHFNRSLIGLCQWFLKSSDEFSCEKRKCSRLGQRQAAAFHWPGSIKILMKEVESAVSREGKREKIQRNLNNNHTSLELCVLACLSIIIGSVWNMHDYLNMLFNGNHKYFIMNIASLHRGTFGLMWILWLQWIYLLWNAMFLMFIWIVSSWPPNLKSSSSH